MTDVFHQDVPPPDAPPDVERIIALADRRAANSVTPEPRRGGIRLWTIDELEKLPEPTWSIEDVLPDQGLHILFAPSSTYKSFVALDWTLSIAAGVPWFDHPVKPGPVVYVAAEGGFGIYRRIHAWEATHPGDPRPRFRVVPHLVDLRDRETMKDLHAALRELVDTIDENPSVVVIDTWSRNTPGANENSAEHTSAAVGLLDQIRAEFECSVLVVHHAGLENGRERGSTALAAAADCRWFIQAPKTKDAPHELVCKKQKDWPEGDPIPFRTHTVGDYETGSLIIRSAADPCRDHQGVIDALTDHGVLSQTRLVAVKRDDGSSYVPGAKDVRLDKIAAAAACAHCDVMYSDNAGTKLYYRDNTPQRPL